MATARGWLAVFLGGALVATAAGSATARRQTLAPAGPGGPCPVEPGAVVSSRMPVDVCIPDGFSGIATTYFDDYSWRSLVALAWPADSGHRGEPASAKAMSAAGPRVFETYKPIWEIFHADGSAPAITFDAYDAASSNPCGVRSGFGDLTIGSASGIDDIGQAGIGALDPPLVAQNGRYVRTLTLFNRIGFDYIVKNRYYLRANLPAVPSPRPETPVLEFPIGTVAVKTAWVDVAGLSPALVKRLYTRTAMVKRANSPDCARLTMGLIGLHIAQKTASRPQWIWSSFEQRDTVPPKWPDSPDQYVLNDGKGAPMPDRNPLTLVPLAPEPVRPFNVFRAAEAPILTPTELSSYAYQRLLSGTPWQYYRLIVTQWPRREGNQADGVPATLDGSIDNTFPGTGAFSAFANVTMETFDQKAVQLGCMSCHNRTRMTTDFMWTVADHAFPSRLAPVSGR